ncbi:MAG TPA: hypothetical protein DCQ37_19275 [Desulfobacteraceae bacterium]|nr:hypothetical protein [Desulfobacteraceae bacterium]
MPMKWIIDRYGFLMEKDEKKVAMVQNGCTSIATFLQHVSDRDEKHGDVKGSGLEKSQNFFGEEFTCLTLSLLKNLT